MNGETSTPRPGVGSSVPGGFSPGRRQELVQALDATALGGSSSRQRPAARLIGGAVAVAVAAGIALGAGVLLRPGDHKSAHAGAAGTASGVPSASPDGAARQTSRARTATTPPNGRGTGSGTGSDTGSGTAGAAGVSAEDAARTGAKATAKAGTKAAAKAAAPAQTQGAVGEFIVGTPSKLCVDPAGSGAGAQLFLQDCTGSARQHWTFASDGTIRSEGLCMDAAQHSRVVGALLALNACTGDSTQRFKLNSTHDLTTLSTSAGMYVCVEAEGGSAGSRLQLAYCQGKTNQKWTATTTG